MVHAERAGQLPLARERRIGYFRACGVVLTDTVVNGVYGLESARLSESARLAREEFPKTAKAAEISTKYAFWIGTAYLGAQLSRVTGPAAGYTLAYAHPFIVGAGVKVARSETPSVDIRKPGLPLFLASFGLLELASTPLFIGTVDSLAHIAGTVNAGVAALSFAIANAVGLAFEYLGFRFLWKKFILKNIEPGSVRDELRGFIGELNPTKLFGSANPGTPARNAGEYVGQVWGNIESLWFWVQLAGVATAIAVAQFYQATPDNFIDLFFQKSALWGKKFLEALAVARCCILMDAKIKQNNEALGIGKSHS